MGKYEKIYTHILMRKSDTNISFDELVGLLIKLGFELRTKGDHYIFTKEGLEEIINLQPVHGKGKPYQIKQVRQIILKYNLKLGDLG